MKRKEKFYSDEQKEIMKFGKILFGLVLIIALLYVFTVYVVNKEDTYERTNTKGKIQYDSLYLGTFLSKPEDEYYVFITDFKNLDSNLYNAPISEYKAKAGHLPLYSADLSNELNKSFIADESAYKSNNIENFKVKGTTLVKVKNGSIVKFIEDKENIIAELK